MTEENWCDHVQVGVEATLRTGLRLLQPVFTSADVFVQYVVEDDPQLQIQLVQMLVKYSGLQKASQWSLKYSVPRDQLPCGVWETQQNLPAHQ